MERRPRLRPVTVSITVSTASLFLIVIIMSSCHSQSVISSVLSYLDQTRSLAHSGDTWTRMTETRRPHQPIRGLDDTHGPIGSYFAIVLLFCHMLWFYRPRILNRHDKTCSRPRIPERYQTLIDSRHILMDGDIMSLVSANQRPVSWSRDHSRPIRGQYPEERQLPGLEFLPIVATAALSLTIGLSDNSDDNSRFFFSFISFSGYLDSRYFHG